MTQKRIDIGVYADWNVPRASAAFDGWMRDIEWLASLGVSDVVIGLADSTRGPADSILDDSKRCDDVHAMVAIAHDYGVDPWLMTWAHRNRAWVEQALPSLRQLQASTGAAGRILDCEGGIMRAGSGLAIDMLPGEFARAVVDAMGYGAWGITGLAQLVAPLQALAHQSPLSIPQPLSVWETDEHFEARKAESKNPHALRPIRGGAPPKLQQDAFASWARYTPSDRIELELGAYYQARPGMSREQCFVRQLEAAVDLGTKRAWLWSLRNLRVNRWTAPIIRSFTGASGA